MRHQCRYIVDKKINFRKLIGSLYKCNILPIPILSKSLTLKLINTILLALPY